MFGRKMLRFKCLVKSAFDWKRGKLSICNRPGFIDIVGDVMLHRYL